MKLIAALNTLRSQILALVLVAAACVLFVVACHCSQVAPQSAILAAAGSLVGGALTLLVGEAHKSATLETPAGVTSAQQTQTSTISN